MFFKRKSTAPNDAADALQRDGAPMAPAEQHFLKGTPLRGPFPEGIQTAVFGLGCFWGAERKFWQLPGVYATAVGYAGGHTEHPGYRDVCSGQTGHAEVVLVAFDPEQVDYNALLRLFWESHDPTQGMRQGNDRGSQYRSIILTCDRQQPELAYASKEAYQASLHAAGYGGITTEIGPSAAFYYAEPEHQQYLAKNPGGYCGLGNTGVHFT